MFSSSLNMVTGLSNYFVSCGCFTPNKDVFLIFSTLDCIVMGIAFLREVDLC